MAYNLDLNKSIFIRQEVVDEIVNKEIRHPNYERSREKARIFNTWHETEFQDFTTEHDNLLADKSYIIKRGSVENEQEYSRKLERMRLFPLESKFLSGQKRIFDDQKIDRKFPDNTKDFWDWKCSNFDDKGSTITEFYRDKCMFIKETLGFGAVGVDIMLDSNNKTINDSLGKPVPYTFVLRAHELYNFKVEQGVLLYVVTRQEYYDELGEVKIKWMSYTPSTIKKWIDDGETKQEVLSIDNPFKKVPIRFMFGESDNQSSFDIGRPRRWHLHGMYLALAELFYDLMQGTALFAHPIPVMPESVVRAMAGAVNDEALDSKKVYEKVGMAITVPDDMPITGNLLYQADMKGLEHITNLLFSEMMSLIFNLAMVRDKTVVKSNVSSQSKSMDTVEEQGLLCATAIDMELLEKDIIELMCQVRGEDASKIQITYSKHYDLSTAQEIFKDIMEMAQYKALNIEVFKYLMREYLKKRSAPQETIDAVEESLKKYGLPKSPSDLSVLKDVISNEDLIKLSTGSDIATEKSIESGSDTDL